ncbi:MAG: endonuclease MutS2 [Nitrospirae bacterium]|nr:endonuclease MutS2 [Nitrospirota bacterium]MBF0536063.1 endonuclease MutS2 [Nitrospirota bacterium]MBF0617976.1 endonuclease MutS2 [Nitrospirota bacterium]
MIDENTVRALEFSKILEIAASYAVTFAGRENILSLRPLSTPEEIQHATNFITEWCNLFAENNQTGIEPVSDLSLQFTTLKPENSIIEPIEIREFIPLFDSTYNLKRFATQHQYLITSELVSNLTTHPFIKKTIENSIDKDGLIVDTASNELYQIRSRLKSLDVRLRKLLDGILQRKDYSNHLQDFFITIRNNRSVIPVKKESKGQIPGVIHDISKTGETIFVEPYVAQTLGNEIESLKGEEKIEEFKIIKHLSSLIRAHLAEIEKDYQITVKIDAVSALSRYSEVCNMSAPEINTSGYVNIICGRHPILEHTLLRQHKSAQLVPLDVSMNNSVSAIVITGSNAGGKTVALKTIGVIHLMALSGMHVAAKSGSSIPFLRNIFVDIGDDQSIEDNISTFSGHLSRISRILTESDNRTLVLLDELGTGTDPDEGGSLASAIVKALMKKGSLVAVTTHLRALKLFAYSDPGVMVGSMEIESLTDEKGKKVFKPTYKLALGQFGQSHAFDIASNYGLSEDIVNDARAILSDSDSKLESLLSDLHSELTLNKEKTKEVDALREELRALKSTLTTEIQSVRLTKKQAIKRAASEAEKLLLTAKSEAAEILKEIKTAEAEKAKLLVRELDHKIKEIKEIKESQLSQPLVPKLKVFPGKKVFLSGLKVVGEVVLVNEGKGRCTVLANGREIEISISALSEMDEKSTQKTQHYRTLNETIDRNVPTEINLIGKRVDPAVSDLERYLNDAVLASLKTVKIIHGLGTGALSKAVREHLSTHQLVQSFRKGETEDGGDAVTIAVLW